MTEPEKPELDEETRALIRWQEENPDAWGDQDENGVDLARLRENRKLTVAQRLQKLENGRYLLETLQNARTQNPVR